MNSEFECVWNEEVIN